MVTPISVTSNAALPFDAVQQALIHDVPTGDFSKSLVSDINTEKNVLITLVYHVDVRLRRVPPVQEGGGALL